MSTDFVDTARRRATRASLAFTNPAVTFDGSVDTP
jgi:hypothetical protein